MTLDHAYFPIILFYTQEMSRPVDGFTSPFLKVSLQGGKTDSFFTCCATLSCINASALTCSPASRSVSARWHFQVDEWAEGETCWFFLQVINNKLMKNKMNTFSHRVEDDVAVGFPVGEPHGRVGSARVRRALQNKIYAHCKKRSCFLGMQSLPNDSSSGHFWSAHIDVSKIMLV